MTRVPSGQDVRGPAATCSDILSREKLSQSRSFPLYADGWVDGVPTRFEKTAPALAFLILVAEPGLSEIVANRGTLAALRASGMGAARGDGGFVVGRYYAADAIPEGMGEPGQTSVWWPVGEDPGLRAFVGRAVERLEGRLGALGRWSSFAEWGQHEAGVDFHAPSRVEQWAITYWWLTGDPRASAAVHELPIYPAGQGLYVDPDDGLVRVYSCTLKAALGQAANSARSGLTLEMAPVHCLGCFLGGSAGVLGREKLRGALLDERWVIEFSTCDRHGSGKPSHFSVRDEGSVFDLVGCPDQGTAPIWVPRRWRTDPDECTQIPWAEVRGAP